MAQGPSKDSVRTSQVCVCVLHAMMENPVSIEWGHDELMWGLHKHALEKAVSYTHLTLPTICSV
eukprot:12238907-Alexandrium_andersonii.AAC.1